jgi:hypothetical protein
MSKGGMEKIIKEEERRKGTQTVIKIIYSV